MATPDSIRRVFWKDYTYKFGSDIARGYLNAATSIRNGLSKAGVEVVDVRKTSRHNKGTVLHFCPGHLFKPEANKRNVLYSMFEGDALPSEFLAEMKKADQYIVPSPYCQAIWGRHGFQADVVPLSVPTSYFATHIDRLPTEFERESTERSGEVIRTRRRLRFLWVGARSARKGWGIIGTAWRKAFDPEVGGSIGDAEVSLYLKSIGDGSKMDRFGGRVTLDLRSLSTRDMVNLYGQADVFIFPSAGEGFGLPPLEAMAAGCLVVSTDVGGLAAFVNSRTSLVIPRSQPGELSYGDAKFHGNLATADDLAMMLREAYVGWGTSHMEAIRAAGQDMALRYTEVRTGLGLARALGLTQDASPVEGGLLITEEQFNLIAKGV